MTENQALDYILSLPKFTYPLGNEGLRKLLSLLGEPQRGMKFVHIAGTNGKGSAAAMLGSILTQAGFRTGVFTSPYILRFNERIKIGNTDISGEKLALYTAEVADKAAASGIKVSQFAFILAVALLYYKNECCDIVVLEAGLGGRLDATNVIENSVVSIIMSISLDHTEYLGDTIATIAKEKCGIIKTNGDVVSYRNPPEAAEVIAAECKSKGASLTVARESAPTPNGFKVGEKEYSLSLKGEYQAGNAATVLAAVEILRRNGFEISKSALELGLKACVHRARFECVRPNIIVDGAHNPDGARALCNALNKICKEKTAVIAMMEDKAVDDVLNVLRGSFKKLLVTELDMPRCMRAEQLCKKAVELGFDATAVPCPEDAFALAEKEEFAVVCGSIYLTGRALDYWK